MVAVVALVGGGYSKYGGGGNGYGQYHISNGSNRFDDQYVDEDGCGCCCDSGSNFKRR